MPGHPGRRRPSGPQGSCLVSVVVHRGAHHGVLVHIAQRNSRDNSNSYHEYRCMDLGDIDLNLLVVFDRLMRERSVSRSADSLGLSQPAISNALRRLRTLLGDELFLRTPAGMAPTPYALQLAEPVAQALDTLHGALNVRASFDPTGSERRFTAAMTDVGETYFLPVLMELLAREAPGVTLR